MTVPRNHSAPIDGVVVTRADLRDDEVCEVAGVRVTSPLRTVLDLARTCDLGWALAAADSALRRRLVSREALRRAACELRGPGATRVRRVAEAADGHAGSCLESLLRALLIEAAIGPLALQGALFRDGHAYDVAVSDARVLLEADGEEFHRQRERSLLDCEDVTTATVEDYLILRFTWYDVTRRPRWVVAGIRRTVERQRRRLARERATRLRAQRRARR